MPWAPSERYDFSPLVRGAAMFGAGVGDAIAGSRERKMQQDEELKREAAAYKGLVSYAANSGLMPKEQAELMSKPELEGALRGLVLKSESERLARDEERKNLEAIAKASEGQAEAAALRGLGNYFQTPQVPMANPPAMNLQALANYARTNPEVANTKAFSQLVEVAKATQGPPDPLRRQTPWGEEYMVDANQIVRQPKEEAPFQTRYSVSYDEMGMPREQIVGPLSDRENIRRMAGIQGEQPAAAVTEAPRDAKAREKGKVYQTPRGPLKWTGTGWVQP